MENKIMDTRPYFTYNLTRNGKIVWQFGTTEDIDVSDFKIEKEEKKRGKKVLIIPDIHERFAVAESIIDLEKPDLTIFLGDYFDSYFDVLEEALYRTDQTAAWLKNSLEQKNRIHLIGNHDMNYMTDNPQLQHGGYARFRHDIIKKYNIDWKKLKLYHWLNKKWLCTHAGLSYDFYTMITEASTVSDIMEFSEQDLENINDPYYKFKFFNVGKTRGGTEKCGGILWCDYDKEFEPIPELNQIFGHTPLDEPDYMINPEIDAEWICLDTHLKHYALYQDNKMKIKVVA